MYKHIIYIYIYLLDILYRYILYIYKWFGLQKNVQNSDNEERFGGSNRGVKLVGRKEPNQALIYPCYKLVCKPI